MYGTCGPQSRARCAASRPWLTNGVEECVVLLVKEKKNPKTKVSLSAWRISSSTEDDTWCSGLCSYQSSSNTSSSLNLSAFVPPGCQGKKIHPGSVRLSYMHSWPQQRQIWELCHLHSTFIASPPGGSSAFRKHLFCWKRVTDGAEAPAQHRSVLFLFQDQ